jgi:hypothetical protein
MNRPRAPEFTADDLRQVLHYEPATGIFTWRVNSGARGRAGVIAGGPAGNRWTIGVFRKRWKAHHLAWYYMTGEWPSAEIDHRDRDPQNNQWDNLRSATRLQNMGNMRVDVSYRNHDLPPGVYRSLDKYQSQLRFNGVKHYLGTFDTPAEAHRAYMTAKAKALGEFCPVIE